MVLLLQIWPPIVILRRVRVIPSRAFLRSPTPTFREIRLFSPSLREMGGIFSRFRRRPSTQLRPYSSKELEAQQEDAGKDDMWLLVGLGNPGPRYAGNRHNVGFMLVDALAKAEGVELNRLQENAAVARAIINKNKVVLAKPMTFMNNSGESVGKLSRFYKIPAERVFVVYDDLDIPSAAVRLRAKGGHGGHNGMKSIQQHLGGSKDFPRLRIGIGRPPGNMPVPAYVLQDFDKKELDEINVAIQEGMDTVRAVLELGIEKAVSGVRLTPSAAR